MSNTYYSKVSTYQIYALTGCGEDGDFCVYIGKTKTQNLRKVLSYHRRKKGLAAPLFTSDAAPEIHLLECIYSTNATAYKHCVAWCRYFLENDINVLCYLGTYEDAYDLLPETETIYCEISLRSIEEILSTPYSPPSEIAPPTEPVSIKKSVRLSVRLSADEYNSFARLCRNNNYTQREGLVSLLAHASEDHPAAKLMQEQKITISHLKSQIEQLRKIPRGIKADQRLKDALAFCQSGIVQYINCLFADAPPSQTSRCYSWKEACRQLLGRKEYHYPAESGHFLFQLQLMCYGQSRRNNAPIFLYGNDIVRNTPVLLRYYAKPEFCGVRPPHSPHYAEGAVFLVGCLVTSDVADMYAAYPIPFESDFKSTTRVSEELSIDDILRNAARRILQ